MTQVRILLEPVQVQAVVEEKQMERADLQLAEFATLQPTVFQASKFRL